MSSTRKDETRQSPEEKEARDLENCNPAATRWETQPERYEPGYQIRATNSFFFLCCDSKNSMSRKGTTTDSRAHTTTTTIHRPEPKAKERLYRPKGTEESLHLHGYNNTCIHFTPASPRKLSGVC